MLPLLEARSEYAFLYPFIPLNSRVILSRALSISLKQEEKPDKKSHARLQREAGNERRGALLKFAPREKAIPHNRRCSAKSFKALLHLRFAKFC